MMENQGIITVISLNLNANSKNAEAVPAEILSLRDLTDNVLFYENIDECVKRIKYFKKEKIILVIAEKGAKDVLHRVKNVRQVDSIFINCTRAEELEHLKRDYTSIAGIFMDYNKLVEALQKQVAIVIKQLEIFNFYRLNQRNIRHNNPIFFWFRLFKDLVRYSPHDERAKQEMLEVAREYYRDNASVLRQIEEFECTYRPKDAIKWFTLNSFIYRLVNKVLRTEQVEQLYKLRYYIQDLCGALAIEHQKLKDKCLSVTVYRGVRWTQDEFNEFLDKGVVIYMNGFLSTSRDRNVAEIFAPEPSAESDKLSIVLEIECDVETLGDKIIFGDIAEHSQFPEEKEFLFDIGSTFQLAEDSVPQQNSKGVWQVKLVATERGQSRTNELLTPYQKEKAPIAFGTALYEVFGKYNASLAYFEKLMAQTSQDEDLAEIHVEMSHILGVQGNEVLGLYHMQHAFVLFMGLNPPRLVDAARIRVKISGMYNDIDQVLDACNYALTVFEQELVGDKKCLEMADILFFMAKIYEESGNKVEAVQVYQRGIDIRDQCVNEWSIPVPAGLLPIAHLCRLQGKFNEALEHFKKVLLMYSYCLPVPHKNFAECHYYIGQTFLGLRKRKSALRHLIIALNMYIQSTPPRGFTQHSRVAVEIGNIYYAMSKYCNALIYYHCALFMKILSRPSGHHKTIELLDQIAMIYNRLGMQTCAVKCYLRALRLVKTAQAPGQVEKLEKGLIFFKLSCLYENLSRWTLAIRYSRRSLKIFDNNEVPEGLQALHCDAKSNAKRLTQKLVNMRSVKRPPMRQSGTRRYIMRILLKRPFLAATYNGD